MGPWLASMFAADQAEARGDALGALEIMEARSEGPDGRGFWRPWRLERLRQITTLGPNLPGWVTSRWILDQAQHAMHEGRREMMGRAEEIAVEARGGPSALEGVDEVDARARVMDRDWICRQQVLYELGGLEHFLRHQATPDLVAGADRIRDWLHTPMGGFRLESSDPRVTTWRDLSSGSLPTGPNIGSAALMDVGEHVIGRLVPIEGGHLFETQPVRVPQGLAHEVAARPTDWLAALRRRIVGAGTEGITVHGLHYQCFVSDVPPLVWQLMVVSLSGADLADALDPGLDPALALAVLAAGRRALDTMRSERPRGAVDVWPCLGAAVLTPYVTRGLAQAAHPSDVPTIDGLAATLAEPAASVCRDLAAELRRAA